MSRVAVALVLVLAACSQKNDAPSKKSPPPPPVGIDAAPPPPPSIDAAEAPPPVADAGADPGSGSGSGSGSAAFHFDDLTKEEQVKYMRAKVVPAMNAEFQAFDKKEFATFNCKTCHGKGALTKEYEMPNPELPELDFAELRAGKHAEMAKFMKEKVVPGMATLLGEAPRGPSNPDGFGCLDCHVETK